MSSSATTSRACAASIRPPSVRWSRSIASSSASLAKPAPNRAPAPTSCSPRFAATTDDSEAASLAEALRELADGRHPERGDFWTPFIARGDFWAHVSRKALLILDERNDILERSGHRDDRAHDARIELEHAGRIPRGLPAPWQDAEALECALDRIDRRVELSRIAGPPHHTRLPFRPVDRLAGKLGQLIENIQIPRRGERVIVSLQAARLSELISDHGLPIASLEERSKLVGDDRVITLARASLPEGWQLRDAQTDAALLSVISDTEIFGFAKQRTRRPPRHAPTEEPDEHLLDHIKPGDYVVHVEHGIARFQGLVQERIGDREREYLDLRYAHNDRLLVPTDQLHRVHPYVGASDQRPALTRLGAQQWRRAKRRVEGAVRDIAEQLLDVHARRDALPGIAMGADTPWQIELEASFPYVETPEQHRAIEEVRRDQEAASPMDRIVIGDVGYGKTEVAVRAAFKAVTNGYQVAILAPTTVLAQQHANTFAERLAAMPVTVEMLSRLRTGAEQRVVVDRLKSGGLDIVIGTHRMLQDDIGFHNLGLVVIDEEQRFGVEHKERLKSVRREVDVLTLSATPIPRSLHQALTGIRDMSTITTPPEERLPITTHLLERDSSVIREAILRELEREGQVYFLHNEVRTIEQQTAELRRLVPEARMLFAHGQMPSARALRGPCASSSPTRPMCSSAARSSNPGSTSRDVNTIVINHADRLGLAQLYQLRGRVGRASVRAFAYLLLPEPWRSLSEVAQKRLATILDATDLGAGFQVAMRDLEIRGAGNLLGAEQSGHIGAVGFTLFTQLLAIAVEQVRAERRRQASRAAATRPDRQRRPADPATDPDRLHRRPRDPRRVLPAPLRGRDGRAGRGDRRGAARPLRPATGRRRAPARQPAPALPRRPNRPPPRSSTRTTASSCDSSTASASATPTAACPSPPRSTSAAASCATALPTIQPLHRTLRDPNWHNDLIDALNAVANA